LEYFVIGERELVLAFKMVGVQGTPALNREEALSAFDRLTGKGGTAAVPASERPKVLILTEAVASMLQDEVLEWQKGAQYPLIVEVPGIQGHLKGRRSLTDAIREAVGIQV
jgi:V/A-type H+-transporting ATPase subunit F